MTRRLLVACTLATAACMPPSHAPSPASTADLAIRGVNVVDVETGTVLADRTVLIRGNRIVAVDAGSAARILTGTHVVDGGGRYLIPGLWDMHVHTVWDSEDEGYAPFFPLFVANGVTGVRDTWGELELARTLRHRMREGSLLGPRLVVAGNLVDGTPPVWPYSQVVTTAEQGRAVVDSLAQAGAAFVKVYSRLSAEVYMAIALRSREVGIPFAGHVPFGVRAADASDAGQRSMEHLYGVLEGCSAEEGAIIEETATRRRALAAGDTSESARDFRRRQFGRILRTQDEVRCRALLARFAARGTWQVPALVQSRGSRLRTEPDMRADPRLRFLRPSLVASWEATPDREWPTERAMHAREMAVVGLMAETGVPLLAGSDTPNPYALPGFGLHDELELLVQAGLTPLQALRSATLNPAQFLNATDSLGTVAPGKLADLVLLDANPLEDIRNSTRIHAVVVNGRYMDRRALDALLEEARAAPGDAGSGGPLPILDMHMHARTAAHYGTPPLPMCAPVERMPRWDQRKPMWEDGSPPPCTDPLLSPTTDEALFRETLAVMERHNVIGVLAGEPGLVRSWVERAPGRFIPGLDVNFDRVTTEMRAPVPPGAPRRPITLEEIRELHRAGALQVLGEVANQYAGIAPDDARLEPLWALAEELDIPVGIHIGGAGPGTPYSGIPTFRARLQSALTLEEVLVRHPRLRVYIMHAGYPLLEDLQALLFTHPQVYVEPSTAINVETRAAFYRFLRGLVEAGYGDRVMFGSDQIIWPGLIDAAVKSIEEAPFLTPEQKRDIFYNNAARFLRLTPEEIARHHGR